MSAPYWASDDGDVVLHLGKCEDVLPGLPANSVDAIVTDPPAAIAFMGRDWDSNLGGRDRWVAWLAECMEKAARVLKPGGHLLVWSLPRTSGWTQWALEDAGLEVRDCIVHLFGSGFPKSLDVSKAIDKRPKVMQMREFAEHLAARREACGLSRQDVSERVVGTRSGACWNWEAGIRYPEFKWWPALRDLLGLDGKWEVVVAEAEREIVAERQGLTSTFDVGATTPVGKRLPITAPATEDAARWEGWGTALKPGQEMWWLARKPIKNTVAANVLEFGTGALNIAACKVGDDTSRSDRYNGKPAHRDADGYRLGNRSEPWIATAGRWPTNIVFTHSAACEPLGVREVRSDGHHPATRGSGGLGTSGHGGQDGPAERKSGTEAVTAWACAPDCPVGELDRQSGVSTSMQGARRGGGRTAESDYRMRDQDRDGGFGDTGGASRFYPTFRYQAKAPASERPRLDDGTAHETVKSLGLMSWLVRLITPPGGTVLDLFAGSGPVGEVCVIEGFRCVLIEQNPKSAELIKTRLAKPIQPAMFGLEAS